MTVTTIRTKQDYRFTISFLRDLNEFLVEGKCKDRAKVEEYIKEQKREIRRYLKVTSNVKVLWGDYDGYTELIEFPAYMDLEECKTFFENQYELHAKPSQYDCTGQKFTTGAKFCYRNDRWYCYHSVGVDV